MRMIFKKILAYTLAEVLITMGIVGAIAAMTIPTLVNKRVQAERSAKLKKFYSKMNNAVDQMVMDNNSFKYMGLPSSKENAYDQYMAYLDRYMGHAMLDKANQTIYFTDESSMKFVSRTYTFSNNGCILVIYDTNGSKSPNQINRDQYKFYFFYGNFRASNLGSDDSFFGPWGQGVSSSTSEEEFINFCKSEKEQCTTWLLYNNWDYPAKYPLK